MRHWWWLSCALMAMPLAQADDRQSQTDDGLTAAIQGLHRDADSRARDQFRHPRQTLRFFELAPDQTVVEVWPGLGWYTEILAPYLHDQGTFYAAHFPRDRNKFYDTHRTRYQLKLKRHPQVYDRVQITEMNPANPVAIAPAGTVDRVLTFRNVHNWMKTGNERDAFASFYAALKPGGLLGVVEHRAEPDTDRETMVDSGYVTEQYVIDLAEAVGFELVARSEINANPKDIKDYPRGVWTLPPTLRLRDQDRAKYEAIGESDRMTLKFRKPRND